MGILPFGMRRPLQCLTFAVALLGLLPLAIPAPLVLEETAKISAPDPSFAWPVSAAIDGDWLITTGFKTSYEPSAPNGYITEYGAWLHRRRSAGSWQLVRRLVQSVGSEYYYGPGVTVDAHQGVAAVVTMTGAASRFVFERSGESWNEVPNEIETSGYELAVDSGTIAVTAGNCDWMANLYRKRADGVWALVRTTDSDPGYNPEYCDVEFAFDRTDISGTSVIVNSVGESGSSVRIFDDALSAAASVTRLQSPDMPGRARSPISIDLPTATAVDGWSRTQYSYIREGSQWRLAGAVQTADELMLSSRGDTELRDGLGVREGKNLDVFARNPDGTYRHAARLVPADRRFMPDRAELNNRRVAARDIENRALYLFELPPTLSVPATLQDGFEDGNYSTWSVLAGSAFSVATVANSKVLRQTSTAGDAAAFLGESHWSNQSVQADVRARNYATGSGVRWFGLVARYTPGNFYYLTVRNSNEVQIKRMTNGTIALLASAPMPVNLNRHYRLRLEAIGTRIRAFVDDDMIVEARDSTHREGQAGIWTYKAAADYDNIVVSANPQTTLLRALDEDSPWFEWETLGDWMSVSEQPGLEVFRQSSLAGDARAIAGIATDDQIVRSSIRRESTSGTANWFGLAVRYRDSRNFYYVTFRNTNVVSLRKLVNGSIVELDSTPFNVASGTWYDVRFEAIGQALRVYVGNQLLLEATDSSHESGRYGLVLYKNAASYTKFSAVQP